MKKVAIILLAIGLISCTLTKKDYKNDEPLPNLAKIKTPKEEAQEEAQEKAEEKLFKRIEEYRKVGILDGHLEYKNEKWKIYQYEKSDFLLYEIKEEIVINDIVAKILSN